MRLSNGITLLSAALSLLALLIGTLAFPADATAERVCRRYCWNEVVDLFPRRVRRLCSVGCSRDSHNPSRNRGRFFTLEELEGRSASRNSEYIDLDEWRRRSRDSNLFDDLHVRPRARTSTSHSISRAATHTPQQDALTAIVVFIGLIIIPVWLLGRFVEWVIPAIKEWHDDRIALKAQSARDLASRLQQDAAEADALIQKFKQEAYRRGSLTVRS